MISKYKQYSNLLVDLLVFDWMVPSFISILKRYIKDVEKEFGDFKFIKKHSKILNVNDELLSNFKNVFCDEFSSLLTKKK